jgi:hypothetical protein
MREPRLLRGYGANAAHKGRRYSKK